MSAQLTQMQTWFMRSLVYPRALQLDELTSYLKDSPRRSADKQFFVYQRSYILRLCKCLQEQFPALSYCLGIELFDEFAREYLRHCPSTSPSLYDLGNRFTHYLEDNRPDKSAPDDQKEAWIDFMIDLSRYEFELFRLFDAPGHEGQQLPDITTSDEQLQLQSCLSLGHYQTRGQLT